MGVGWGLSNAGSDEVERFRRECTDTTGSMSVAGTLALRRGDSIAG
jgi:hypothetical protein